ncbi:MAG: potassium channel family protein [Desulfobacula sp.]|uniref:potassium channel family protein n=1 Tax=Desulfobacula sp. TaxID=2593537 RepID=UPI0025BAECE7|nr:potassium channel family protein [Desulfobacula sp.]MCD4718592.1 potassium channel family protein [Desulfobacula sp.]
MEFTFEFIRLFLVAIYVVMPLLIFLSFWIVILGQVVGFIEGWNKFDSLYWSFITALTVGYGDLHPLKKSSKTLSVIVGLTGIMFTGIVVAVTVHTATLAFEKYVDLNIFLQAGKLFK